MGLKVRLIKQLQHFELDLDFTCGAGQLLALVGPSGAGKTTTVRIVAGLDRPEAGTIRYQDQFWVDTAADIFLPPQQRRVGYVFQDFPLFPHLTVYKNVAFACQDGEQVENILRLLGIWHLKDCYPQRISGGERQRTALCQALAHQSQVLLLDEPFSALDVATRRRLREELKSLKHELARPILYVTHDLEEASYLADEVLPMVQGHRDQSWLSQQLYPGSGPALILSAPQFRFWKSENPKNTPPESKG
ncbi:MAG: ATP-binding cassette domain-containing protein [Desulfobacca sp.]|nr:ATP-binding cassette domain-containing protein [Desulfobacca sp.]